MTDENSDPSGSPATAPANTTSRDAPSSNYRRYALWGVLVLLLVFGVFGIWAAIAPLSGAVIAQGSLAAASSSKVVKHESGGVVREIVADEGETVDEGDVLIRLDPTQARAELEEVRAQWITSSAEQTRLQAELDGDDSIEFPERLDEVESGDVNRSRVLATQRAIFDTRRSAVDSERAQSRQRIERLRGQIEGLQEVIASTDEQIASYSEEIEEWSDLYEDELANKQDLRAAKRRKLELESERASRKAEIARLRSDIQETEMEITLRMREYRREVAARLGDAQRSVLEASARLPALEQALERTRIRAPDSGQVVDLRVNTVGGVVARGDPMMKIVPSSGRVLVRARVKPSDIDNVRSGQKVTLRFPALNTALIEAIEGNVKSISADTIEGPEGEEEYYLARIEVTEEGTRQLRNADFDLQPGMPVTSMIRTEERSLVSYLLNPITEMMSQSMREP